MREIKFRVWDKKSQTMFYSSDAANFDENTGREYFPFVFEIGYKGRRDLELMQFTGRKDKNGKEIYEGDLLRGLKAEDPINKSFGVPDRNPDIGKAFVKEVRFVEGCFTAFGHPLFELDHYYKDCEVIGNIYQPSTE